MSNYNICKKQSLVLLVRNHH